MIKKERTKNKEKKTFLDVGCRGAVTTVDDDVSTPSSVQGASHESHLLVGLVTQ